METENFDPWFCTLDILEVHNAPPHLEPVLLGEPNPLWCSLIWRLDRWDPAEIWIGSLKECNRAFWKIGVFDLVLITSCNESQIWTFNQSKQNGPLCWKDASSHLLWKNDMLVRWPNASVPHSTFARFVSTVCLRHNPSPCNGGEAIPGL